MNETLTVRIEAVAQGGEGVARPAGGPVLFVAGAVTGDLVRAEVLERGRRLWRGRVVEVLQPGPGRRQAPCPWASTCGGCSWQHVDEAGQAAAVRALLVEALERLGGVGDAEALVAQTLCLPSGLAYRHRMRMHVDLIASPPRAGFLRHGSHDVEAVPACLVLEPALESVRARIASAATALAQILPGARLELGVDLPSPDAGIVELRVVQGHANTGALEAACAVLMAAAPVLRGIAAHGPGGVVARMGVPRVRHLRGPVGDAERWPAYQSPGGFMQASRAGNQLLVSQVLEAVDGLALPRASRVLELHAGNGNFTLPLAGRGFRVLAVEASRDAAQDARQAVHEAGLEDVVEVRDAEAGRMVDRLAAAGETCDLVVLDPPRTGARDVASRLAALEPAAVVYVSCDAPTLARDVAILQAGGLRLVRATPLALFPQTAHFETVAVLRRG